jgi:hypothetical protein
LEQLLNLLRPKRKQSFEKQHEPGALKNKALKRERTFVLRSVEFGKLSRKEILAICMVAVVEYPWQQRKCRRPEGPGSK